MSPLEGARPSMEEMMAMLQQQEEDLSPGRESSADYDTDAPTSGAESSEEKMSIEEIRAAGEKEAEEAIEKSIQKEATEKVFGTPDKETGLFNIDNGLLEVHSMIDKDAYARTIENFTEQKVKNMDSQSLLETVKSGEINRTVVEQMVGAQAKGVVELDPESISKAVDVLLELYQGPVDKGEPGMTIAQAREVFRRQKSEITAKESGMIYHVLKKELPEKKAIVAKLKQIESGLSESGVDYLKQGISSGEISSLDLQRLISASEIEEDEPGLSGISLSGEQKKQVMDILQPLILEQQRKDVEQQKKNLEKMRKSNLGGAEDIILPPGVAGQDNKASNTDLRMNADISTIYD